MLALIFLLALFVEAVVGFGATIITVALGAQFLPIEQLVPVLLPLNLLLLLKLVAAHHRHIARRFLLGRIIPGMALGFIAGFFLSTHAGGSVWLKLGFAVFLVLISSLELWRAWRKSPSPPLPTAQELAWLSVAGVVHGIYSTGGPMVVYCASRRLPEKSAFRATMAALWLLLGLVLLVGFVATGRVNRATLEQSAWLLPSLVVGALAGEWLHGRIDGARFKSIVYAVLLVAGMVLLSSTLLRG